MAPTFRFFCQIRTSLILPMLCTGYPYLKYDCVENRKFLDNSSTKSAIETLVGKKQQKKVGCNAPKWYITSRSLLHLFGTLLYCLLIAQCTARSCDRCTDYFSDSKLSAIQRSAASSASDSELNTGSHSYTLSSFFPKTIKNQYPLSVSLNTL